MICPNDLDVAGIGQITLGLEAAVPPEQRSQAFFDLLGALASGELNRFIAELLCNFHKSQRGK